MFRLFFVFALCIIAATAHAQNSGYTALCHNGVVSAKKTEAKGPERILTLLIGGTKSFPCKEGDKIELDSVSEITETPLEGRRFSAMVTVIPKVTGAKIMILSTFQEKPFPRSVPGKGV